MHRQVSSVDVIRGLYLALSVEGLACAEGLVCVCVWVCVCV